MAAPTRERLHRLVDQLPDDELADALLLLENRIGRGELPGFVGMLRSGKGDLSERVKDIYRAGIASDRR